MAIFNSLLDTVRRVASALAAFVFRPKQPAEEPDATLDVASGYDRNFLGLNVPLPGLTTDMLALATFAPTRTGEARHVLPYPHFSVVMNSNRRLAFYTAVNIDGARAVEIERERDKWIFDARLPKAWQIGDELYDDNPLDRGHLVRRKDPNWGSPEEAGRANEATFHFTNCAPQHEQFNRNKQVWAGLEDYVLNNAKAHELKLAVFTGPVFKPDDPLVNGHGVPREFWKIVAWRNASGQLRAAAYKLDQSELLQRMRDFTFGKFKTYQTSVRVLQRDTGLNFGALDAADVFRSQRELGRESRELSRLEDMILS